MRRSFKSAFLSSALKIYEFRKACVSGCNISHSYKLHWSLFTINPKQADVSSRNASLWFFLFLPARLRSSTAVLKPCSEALIRTTRNVEKHRQVVLNMATISSKPRCWISVLWLNAQWVTLFGNRISTWKNSKWCFWNSLSGIWMQTRKNIFRWATGGRN